MDVNATGLSTMQRVDMLGAGIGVSARRRSKRQTSIFTEAG